MLRLFGVPYCEGHPGLSSKAVFAVAALLFEFEGKASRRELAEFLYADATPAVAQANLRQLLYKLRPWQSKSGMHFWTIEDKLIKATQTAWDCDAAQLLSMRVVNTMSDLCRVQDIWSGEFLDGCPHDAALEYGSWIVQKRSEMTEHLARLLAQAHPSLNGDLLDSLLAKLSRLLPYDDQVMLRRIENLAAMGDDGEAGSVYRQHAQVLERNLDSPVSEQTSQAVFRILGRPVQPTVVGTVETPSSSPDRALGDEQKRRIPRVIMLPPPPGQGSRKALSLASGLTEDVVFFLCRLRSFAMIAPHSARQMLSGSERVSVPTKVDYLVSTSLVQSESQLRFRFKLLRMQTQEILLADEIRFQADLLEGEKQLIARGIASSLSDGVAAAELAKSSGKVNPSAYVNYLRGVQELQKPGLASLRRARHLFEASLEDHRGYVPALAKVAYTLSREWLMLARSDRELVVKAREMAEAAVNADPFYPDGLRELGNAHLYLNALEDGERYHELAVSRAPHHADTLADAADLQVHISNFPEAERLISKALELNPFSPDEYLWTKGSTQFFLGNYSNSLQALLSMKDQQMVDRLIAASAAMLGDLKTASRHRSRWMSRYPDFRVADYRAVMPQKDKAVLDQFVDALRRAGFR